MSSVEWQKLLREVLTMSTVPVEIQDRLEALEARRLEIIAENAVDRNAAEYAVARIAERKAEKSRLKIEARALRMAVDAYAAKAVELVDLEGLRWAHEQPAMQAALPEIMEVEQELEPPDREIIEVGEEEDITEVEQPEGGVVGEAPLASRILRRLKEVDRPLTRREIANAIGQDPDRISTELSSLKRRNLVVIVEGHGWSVP